MNKHRKKLIKQANIVLLILVATYYLLRIFIIGRPITSFYSNNPKKITRIEITSGNTGDVKTITSQDEIKTITDYLSTLTFKKAFPPTSSGWNYNISAYAGDRKILDLTDMGKIYTISDWRYKVTSSNDSSLSDLLDTYMD